MQNINIQLTLDETNAIINVLGQMPTSSGSWPLLMKIREQAAAQLPLNEQAAPEPEEVEDAPQRETLSAKGRKG